MTTTTRSTELEAVNTILSTIGEAPLNSLSGSLPVDGTMAKNVLSEISREVQSAGWHFNTHYKSTLTRDTNNNIPVATSFRRKDLFDNKNENFAGSFGTSVAPDLISSTKKSDLIIVLGARLG